MDQPVARGTYVDVGAATYLVVQHDALTDLPTLIGLPATATPLPHRPPLVIRDDTNDLWIHTFAPATLLRTDIATIVGTASDLTLTTVEAALGAVLHLCPLQTAARVHTPTRSEHDLSPWPT